MQLRAFDERVGRASWRGFCWGAAAGSLLGTLWASELVPEIPRFVATAPGAVDLAVAYSGVALSKLSIITMCAWGTACVVGAWVRFVMPQSRAFD
jgi:hypothetical protein